MADESHPKDEPYEGLGGLDPKRMKALRREADAFSDKMMNTSANLKSQLDHLYDIRTNSRWGNTIV